MGSKTRLLYLVALLSSVSTSQLLNRDDGRCSILYPVGGEVFYLWDIAVVAFKSNSEQELLSLDCMSSSGKYLSKLPMVKIIPVFSKWRLITNLA